jgi:hypothetical protein
MTRVEYGMREASGRIRESCLRGVRPYARPSRLVCFAHALVHLPRSTSAGCVSRLQVYGARVWRHGVAVRAQDCRHMWWAHANAIQPLSCRVTTKICLRGRRIHVCPQGCRSYPFGTLMRFANLPSLQRPGRAASSVSTARSGPKLLMTPPLIADCPCLIALMSATAALSTHHMPLSLSEQRH